MNYSMLEEARELAGWSKESEALSIYQALETIEDLRSKQLNSFVLALFDFCKVSNAKQYMRSLDAHPLQAARLLLKSLEEN
jgi:hypothetical protein